MRLRDLPFYLLGGGPVAPRRREEPRLPAAAQPEARVVDPEPHPRSTRFIFLPAQLGGVRVTEETALRVAVVWACVSWISKSIASSRWDVLTVQPNGDLLESPGPMWRLLNVEPNPEVTAFKWRFTALWQMLIHGNHYSEIERDTLGRPVALWDMDPRRVCPDRDANLNLIYRVQQPLGGEVLLPARNVFHISGPGDSSILGHDTMTVAAQIFGTAIASDTFTAAFFANMLMPGVALEHDKTLTDPQRKDLRESLDEVHGGPTKAFRPLLLEGGVKAKPLSSSPEQAQVVEQKHLLIEDICRFYGVPPQKAMHLLRMTFDNVEELNIDAVRDGLVQHAEQLRQEADRKLLPPRNRTIRSRIELDWLTEGSAKDRAEADAALVHGTIATPNELRRRRGWNRSKEPNADKLQAQQAMTTLDKLGQDPAPPSEPEREDPPETPEEPRLTVVENQ